MASKSVHGYAVYNALLKRGPLTKRQLMAATARSASQIEAGLNNIREVLADRYAEPITYNPHDYSYDLARTEKVAVEYLVYRLGILRKWVHNLNLGTASPSQAKFASPALDVIAFALNQLEAQIEFARKQLAKTP